MGMDVVGIISRTLGYGVTRSKQMAMRWKRKAAENGDFRSCLKLAHVMYSDRPYAREVGHEEEASGVATSAEVMEGHDVPPDVLTSVCHWLQKGGQPITQLEQFRRKNVEGYKFCRTDGCEVVGHLKDFRVCPQCKTARYCGDACQAHDWTTGGHKETCGKVTRQIKANYCVNAGCEVLGYLRNFKVCPQCYSARYCGDACQKQDWNAVGTR